MLYILWLHGGGGGGGGQHSSLVTQTHTITLLLQVCDLELQWLIANTDTEGVGIDLDQNEGGERRVVSVRGGEGAQFTVQLSSGQVLTCGLPPIYPHILPGQSIPRI